MSASIAIEDMQVGHRYLNTVDPAFEGGWTVTAVELHVSTYVQVHRGGAWIYPEIVTVTYGNGRVITHERGTDIAIECDKS